jgi:hypothetical protein
MSQILCWTWVVSSSFVLSIEPRNNKVNPPQLTLQLCLQACPFTMVTRSAMHSKDCQWTVNLVVCDHRIPIVSHINFEQLWRFVLHFAFLCLFDSKQFQIVLMNFFRHSVLHFLLFLRSLILNEHKLLSRMMFAWLMMFAIRNRFWAFFLLNVLIWYLLPIDLASLHLTVDLLAMYLYLVW